MVFKRRNKRSAWRAVADALWPRTGWARAFRYIKHRLWRLPDPPHRIARGIFAGVFVTFTPFFGLHFVLATIVAFILRGNIVAALLATFFGNPLTFFFIGAGSLQIGYFLLGISNAPNSEDLHGSLGEKFVNAGRGLTDNFWTMFTDEAANWTELRIFYNEVFFPYLVGGIIPGIICGLSCYYFSLPVIQAYQNRRKGRLRAKLLALKEKAAAKADARKKPE